MPATHKAGLNLEPLRPAPPGVPGETGNDPSGQIDGRLPPTNPTARPLVRTIPASRVVVTTQDSLSGDRAAILQIALLIAFKATQAKPTGDF